MARGFRSLGAGSFDERPQRILRPVRPGFILLTLVIALVLNFLPWRSVVGIPDWVAIAIVFWGVHEPRRMGIGLAWALGIVMDAANGALLGQHALAYSVLAFASIALSRRMLWFPVWPQAAHVLPLLLGCQLLMLGVRLAAGGAFPGILYFAGSFIGAALWPVVTMLLLVPQRMPESVDENRPI
jgi:rod shape-determining protein MreD